MGKIEKWEDCGRDDLNMIPKMEAAGFVTDINYIDKRYGRTIPTNPPLDEVGFKKDDMYFWKCYRSSGESYWRSAKLVKGCYVDPEEFEDLNAAILKYGKA